MSINLLRDRVLIEVEKKEEKTQNGLILTKKAEMGEPMIGVVKYVGEGIYDATARVNRPMVVKAGQNVIFEYGKEFLLEGKTYFLAREEDVIAII